MSDNTSSSASSSSSSPSSSSSSSSPSSPLIIPTDPATLVSEGNTFANKIIELFKSDYAYEASKAYHSLQSAIDSSLSSIENDDDKKILSQLKNRLASDEFLYIKNLNDEVNSVLEIFKAEKLDESWKIITNKDGIITHHRSEPGTATHTLFVQGEVDSPLFNLLAMVYEIELLPKWLPVVSAAKRIALLDGARFRLICQMQIATLWPVAGREVLVYGYGDVVGDSIVVYFRSIHSNEVFPGIDLPSVPSGHVRAELKLGGISLTPIDSHRTLVKAVYNTDPKLSLIPYSLINWFSEKLCYLFISLLRKKAKEIGTKKAKKGSKELEEHEIVKSIANNRWVYGEIERRLRAIGGHAAAAFDDHKEEEKQ